MKLLFLLPIIFVICVIGYTQQAIATEPCIEDLSSPNIKSYNKIVLAKVVEKQETGPECYDDGTDRCHYTEKLTFEKIKNYKGNLSLTFYINNDYRYSPTYGYDLFDGPYLLKPNQLVLLSGDGKDNQEITPIYCGGVIHLGKYDEKTDSNVYSHYLYDDDKYDTFESWLDSLLLSSPLKQIKSGILPQDIQCSVNHIHMVYDNIKHVCVNHNTATKLQERTGWEIFYLPAKVQSKHQEIILSNESLKVTDHVTVKSVPLKESLVDTQEQISYTSTKSTPKLASYAEYQKMFDSNFSLISGKGWVDMSGQTTKTYRYYEDPETGKMVLDFDALFGGAKPIIFPRDSLIYLQVDKTKYEYGDTIHVKGKVSDVVALPCSEKSVNIKLVHDDSKFHKHVSAIMESDCSYQTTINITGSSWINNGTYTVTASSVNSEIKDSTIIELLSTFVPYQRISDSADVVLDFSSPVDFVDDGRKYPFASGGSGPPHKIYDKISQSYRDFYVDHKGVATFTPTPHEKYSLNPGKGHYIEDWIPGYIPDGQRLLYAETNYDTFEQNGKTYETYNTGIFFVPTTFELTPFTTNHLLDSAKGFNVKVRHSTMPHDELEDISEDLREKFIEDEWRGYGEIRELTHDGKSVLAFAGGNGANRYQSLIMFYPDEFTTVNVSSKYHTIDELIPIFESIMK